MSRTIEQKRASFSLNKVQFFCNAHQLPKVRDKMATHINKTPIRILNNGLGQALAFLQADNEGKTDSERKESGKLYDWLQEWLSGVADNDHPCRVYRNGKPDLIGQLMAGNRDDYMRAQEEAIALFTWLKKFADAYLPLNQQPTQGGGDASS